MEYLCKNCLLTFSHEEITAEDEYERDLCPACCSPIGVEDEL